MYEISPHQGFPDDDLQPKSSNELVSIKSGSLCEDMVSTFETHLWGDILDREKQWC